MPLFEIIHLRLFWNVALGKPFLDVPFPVTVDKRLVDVIWDELRRREIDPSGFSADFAEDIKSAKTPSGMDASRLLELPVSTFFQIVASDSIKKLTVVINKPTPLPPLPRQQNPLHLLRWWGMRRHSTRTPLPLSMLNM